MRGLQSFELMTLKGSFFDDNGRVRSGWRFALFVFSFIVIASVLGLAGVALLESTAANREPNTTWYFVVSAGSMLPAALLAGWLCARFLERLPFSSLGAAFIPGWLKRFGRGLAVGALTLGSAVLIPLVFGRMTFTVNDADSSAILRTMLLSFIVFLIAAAGEEALFRGYMMQTFFRSHLAAFGILLTSLLFATVHVGNPQADLLSWVNTFLAGLWFAVAYFRTRDLWMPFGMHLMWNWSQGSVFGIEVSGLTDVTYAPLLKEIDRGPAWLTGEAYGIEAGIASTAPLLISTVVILLIAPKGSDPDL